VSERFVELTAPTHRLNRSDGEHNDERQDGCRVKTYSRAHSNTSSVKPLCLEGAVPKSLWSMIDPAGITMLLRYWNVQKVQPSRVAALAACTHTPCNQL